MHQDIQRLLDIDAIKQVKARYFRAIDTQDWAAYASCFTEDVVVDNSEEGMGELIFRGRDKFVQQLAEMLKDAKTVHHGHMPEITFHASDRASVIWAMNDIVEFPNLLLQGWGHYHEEYVREEEEWKIASMRLARLRRVLEEQD